MIWKPHWPDGFGGSAYVPAFQIDPHPFARGGSFAICAVSVMHMTQAALMLTSTSAVNATSLTALLIAWHGVYATDGVRLMAALMIVTAAMALFGALFRLGWIRLLIFVPQHFLLGIMACGGAVAALRGAYLDGTVKPWEHIAADQLALLALFVIHSSAIVRRARDPNG